MYIPYSIAGISLPNMAYVKRINQTQIMGGIRSVTFSYYKIMHSFPANVLSYVSDRLKPPILYSQMARRENVVVIYNTHISFSGFLTVSGRIPS